MNDKRFLTFLAVFSMVTLNIACWWFFTSSPAAINCSGYEDDISQLSLKTETGEFPSDIGEMAALSALQNNLFPNRIVSINIDFNYPLD